MEPAQVQNPKEMKNLIKTLILDGYKVLLDKQCKQEFLRHIFYQVEDDIGHHFYHVRYSYPQTSSIPKIKDYDVINVTHDDSLLSKQIDQISNDIINNYIENGYEIKCNKKE